MHNILEVLLYVTMVTRYVTLFALQSVNSPITTVQTVPVNVMTLFVIDTITTLLPAVLTKRIAVTLCRKSKNERTKHNKAWSMEMYVYIKTPVPYTCTLKSSISLNLLDLLWICILSISFQATWQVFLIFIKYLSLSEIFVLHYKM